METITPLSEVLITQLKQFQYKKTLNSLGDGTVVVLGYFSDDADFTKPVIIKVGSLPPNIPEDANVQEAIQQIRLELKTESGSRFLNFNGFGSEYIKYGVEVIYPATEVDIRRNTRIQMHIIYETPIMFETIVKPITLDTNNIQWVYNILDGKKEVDRVLYNSEDETAGFLLNIDTKWRDHPDISLPREQWKGHTSTRNLYCLALVRDRSLRSLRDFRGEHADMLEELLHKSLETIEDVYGIPQTEIRAFIHYPPQFYHVHIHFTRVGNEFGCPVEKAHMLADVIDLLRMDGDVFAKRTLTCRIGENDKLFDLLRTSQDQSTLSRKRDRQG